MFRVGYIDAHGAGLQVSPAGGLNVCQVMSWQEADLCNAENSSVPLTPLLTACHTPPNTAVD
eukprot:1149389-Pelagomonas_calceolata.AAC.9